MNYTVSIAGEDYTLRYRLSDREEIEKRAGKTLWDAVFSGLLQDQAVVIWAGIRHERKKLTPAAVIDLLELHIEKTGESYQPIYLTAMEACLKSKTLGNVNEAEIDRVLAGLREGKAEAQ